MIDENSQNSDLLSAQRREIIRLMAQGFPLEITQTVSKRKPGFLGYLQKREKEQIKHTFTIQEPCLNIIDHISLESLNFDIKELEADEKKQWKHIDSLAKILALVILGREYEYLENGRYVQDNKRLKEIISILKSALRPSDMYNIVEMADIVSNHGDFTNSIRLITGAAKKANLIEEKQPV